MQDSLCTHQAFSPGSPTGFIHAGGSPTTFADIKAVRERHIPLVPGPSISQILPALYEFHTPLKESVLPTASIVVRAYLALVAPLR